ncbi:cellulose-binding domain-containing protein [Actinoplanes sp. NPDC051861]|uniref:cellulose-binding domain-containing protein n=1 Tax=Actinoplanes sp. NPDC051861 TaxID=3155170 RepID=UPI00343D2375
MRLSRTRPAIAALVVATLSGAGILAATVTARAAATGCRATYGVTSSWQGGFTASVSVTNLGDPISGWTLTWAFGAGQRVTQAWGATVTQTGSQVSAGNASWNAALPANGSASFGFNGSWSGSNPSPATFALNGVTCTGTATPGTPPASGSPSASPSASPSVPPGTGTPNSMGFIGCSMAENVSQGYVAVGGRRMWGPYGTGGLVVQSWTDTNSSAWQKFDQQSSRYGRPSAVWVQICIFAQNGVTYDEVRRLITNARQHAAPGAAVYITGQPLYDSGQSCSLAGANGPALTDSLARQAAADSSQNVTYSGQFRLRSGEVADGCHANTAGQASLGRQALAYWG